MPLRKRVGYYGLRDLEYSIIDNSENSPNFFRVIEFPDKFKAGKNLFKIAGNRDNLVNGSEIQLEILDYNGNPIYYEPLKYVEKDGTRVIAVYIYPDTSPGECTVYLAGRAQRDPSTGNLYRFSKQPDDPDYFEKPNVVWLRTCNVAPKASNDVEIIYTQQPRVTITEVVQAYLQPVDVYNVFTQVTGSGTITLTTPLAIPPNISLASSTNVVEGGNTTRTPSFGTQYYNNSATKNTLSSTVAATTTSPIIQTISGFSNINTSQAFFSASMVGGTITVVNPIVLLQGIATAGTNNLVYPASQFNSTTTDYTGTSATLSGSYEFAVLQVYNSTSARVAQIAGFANGEDTLGQFSVSLLNTNSSAAGARDSRNYTSYIVNSLQASSNFTASYIKPSEVIYTQNSASFADIILANIEPATGDVYRVKTLYKPSGQFGEFVDLGDTIVEQSDILIDENSLETNVTVGSYYENFGLIESLQEINTYWTGSGLGTVSTFNPMAITYDMDTLIGGIRMLPNNTTFQQDDAVILSVKPQYHPLVYKNTEYIVKFSIANDPLISSYSSVNSNIPNARLDVYISGSTVTKQDAFTFVSNGSVITGNDFNSTVLNNFKDNGVLGTRIGTYETTFVPASTSYITFRFVATDDKPIDIKFVTRNGAFIIGNIQILANQETGFSPNFIRINKRIPSEHLNTPLTFKFQYYDFRGRKADTETIAYGAIFDGDNTYINGTNNLLTGSVFIGNSIGSGIEMAGVNSGYIRSIGYEGFISASDPTKGGQSGWIIYSGSVLPNSGDNYSGVGIELVTDADNYFRFRTNPSELDIHTKKFFLGSTNQYISGANGNIAISSSNFYLDASGNVTMAGTITATAGTIGGFAITSNAISSSNNSLILRGNDGQITGSSVLFTGGNIGGFSLSSTQINDTNNNLVLKSSGQITGSRVLFNGGTIGGFTIDSTKITGSNIIIDSAGSIQTANYASDLTGWKISAAGNGFAEFENVKIRGTLSTAVFEKQSVNAVGGQLYVANSTVLTGSNATGASTTGQYTATQTTMSVENVTGFEVGEIITAKKFSGTGFATEYMRINSASRDNPSSDTDFTGRIYVTRGLGNGVAGNSGSLGETPGVGQPYSGSQVIVSTGKQGTGFIRINASPNDQATPYIDIVERTGSGIYDVSLKARLGDLSGLANSTYVFGNSNPGFGLATDNVFLQGGIIANFGNIGGFNITSNAITGSAFYLSGSATGNGFFISASNFNVKANGNVTASSALFSGSVSITGNVNARTGNIGGFNITSNAITGSGFYISGSAANNGTAFFISSSRFNIKGNGDVTGSNVLFSGGKIGGFTVTSDALTGGKFQTSANSSTTRIVIDGTASPASIKFYRNAEEAFAFVSSFTVPQRATLSKGTLSVCPANPPTLTTTTLAFGGIDLKNNSRLIATNGANLADISAGSLDILGDANNGNAYLIESTRRSNCSITEPSTESGVARFEIQSSQVTSTNAVNRIAVKATAINVGANNISNFIGIYSDASTSGTGTAYSFYGNDGLLYNADSVGIGTTTMTYKLNVQGDINAIGSVRANGTALTSDLRLKSNIINITNGISIIKQLRPVAYDKKIAIDSNHYNHDYGFIAQELQTVLPDIVMEGLDADKILSINYTAIIPILTKAIQEQQQMIDQLTTRIQALELK